MVRRKIEIKAIEDKPKRHTTFTKRRNGLQSKAKDLCILCGAQAAVFAFSKAGNSFSFGHPRVDSIITHRLAQFPIESPVTSDDGDVAESLEVKWTERRIAEGMASGQWDAVVGDLGLAELVELEAEVLTLKSAVAARVKEIRATATEGSSAGGGENSTT